MNRDAALSALRQHQAEFHDLGVKALYLFGSTAHETARADSDVDLFFDHERGALSLFDVMDIAETASTILGRKADVMTRGSIDRYIRDRVEADAIRVF